jgi:hypothetical protein
VVVPGAVSQSVRVESVSVQSGRVESVRVTEGQSVRVESVSVQSDRVTEWRVEWVVSCIQHPPGRGTQHTPSASSY